MNISFVIIDDDLNDLNLIEKSLYHIYRYDQISIKKALYYSDDIVTDNVDLYILDIDMKEKTGYEVASAIYKANQKAKIAFCSNHSDFVYDTFPFNPFYFIRKEKIVDDLLSMSKKLTKYLEHEKLNILNMNNAKKIFINNIQYINAFRNYTELHMENDEVIRIRKPFKDFLYLTTYTFCFISRGLLINFDYVDSIENEMIHLNNHVSFHISRNLKKEVLFRFKKYLMEH